MNEKSMNPYIKGNVTVKGLRNYVDGNGCNVMEYSAPGCLIYVRYNYSSLYYTKNQKIIYNGKFNKAVFDSIFDEIDKTIDADTQLLDKSLANIDKVVEGIDKSFDSLDKAIDSLDKHLSSGNTTISYNYNYGNTTKNPHSYTRRSTYDDYQEIQKFNKEVKKTVQKGCLGCLGWTLFLLAILCLMLYGLGTLGSWLFNIIIDFFKAILGLF